MGGLSLKKAIPPKNPELAILAILAFFSPNVKNCLFLLKKDANEIFYYLTLNIFLLLFSWRIFMRKTHSQAEIWAFKKNADFCRFCQFTGPVTDLDQKFHRSSSFSSKIHKKWHSSRKKSQFFLTNFQNFLLRPVFAFLEAHRSQIVVYHILQILWCILATFVLHI